MSTRSELYEVLRPFLPQEPLPIVRASVDAVSRLPGLRGWKPTPTPVKASQVLQLGFALTFLSSVSSCDALKRRISNALFKDLVPEASDLAEINGAALCAALGAVKLDCIKRNAGRTPDFKVCWPSQTEIDLEVTCAQEKPAHVERRRIAGDLAERIHDKGRSYDIVLHYIEPPTERELSTIVKASTAVALEQPIEDTGKWAMRAVRSQRETFTIMTVGEPDNAPDWWPSQPIKNFVAYQFLAGPGDTLPPPQTRVIYAVPFDGYINPLQNKADRPQGFGTRPFLIAIDVGNLPGAFFQFRQRLSQYFPTWQRLSGVLTFRSWIGSSRVGWSWGLIANPIALHPLPPEVLDKGTFEKEMDTFAPLEERGKPETQEAALTARGD